jgi:hypothetical protein
MEFSEWIPKKFYDRYVKVELRIEVYLFEYYQKVIWSQSIERGGIFKCTFLNTQLGHKNIRICNCSYKKYIYVIDKYPIIIILKAYKNKFWLTRRHYKLSRNRFFPRPFLNENQNFRLIHTPKCTYIGF